MKKSAKIIVIILGVLILLLLIDTAQAKVFDNKPIIKVVEDYNGGNLYQKHRGVLVDTYVYTDGEQKTVFKWEKYSYHLQDQSGQLPEINELANFSEEQLNELFVGVSEEEIHQSYGEVRGILSGFWGDLYNLPDGEKRIIFYYNTDGKVQAVKTDYID